jgi:tetratricopeptide (TPR) repeat protein
MFVRFPFSVFSKTQALVGALATCCLLLATSNGAEPLPLGTEYWKDEAFLKAFNGSYRIEARIEPAVSSEERGLLVEVQGLMAKGERKAALETVAGSRLTAGSAALRFNLGNLRFEEGEVEKAVEDYRAAIGKYPSFRRAHRNLAVALIRLEKPDEALKPLLEAVRLGDSDGATFGLLGWCRLQREEWASALQAYRMAQLIEPGTPEWLAGTAQCLQQIGEDEEAAALLDEVVRKRPTEVSYGLLRGDVLLGLGRNTEAAAGLDLMRRLEVLDGDGQLLLAKLHLRGGRGEVAAESVKAAFAGEKKPSVARALAALAEATDRKAWEVARLLRDRCGAVVEQESAKRRLARTGARIDIESGDDPAAGAERLEGLLKADPLDGGALLVLGRHRAAETRREEAELLLQRATEVDEVAHEAWVEIARVRVDGKRYEAALEAVDEALELRQSEELSEYREALAGLVEAGR